MKNLVSKIIVVLLVSIFPILISAQTNKKTEIKQIEAYSKTLDAFIKNHKNPNLIVADVSDYRKDTHPLWRKFNSKKALEKTESYDDVYAWQKNGKLVQVNFTQSSPSGDWMQFINHYFREDGTLAKVEARLNTFYGNVSVLRSFYFDRSGKLLSKTSKYYDLETQKRKKRSEVDFMNQDEEIFKKTSQLPFIALLTKKRN